MVTHDPRAERFVDTVYRVDKGSLIGAETVAQAQAPRPSGTGA
jgi:hypothetical protein